MRCGESQCRDVLERLVLYGCEHNRSPVSYIAFFLLSINDAFRMIPVSFSSWRSHWCGSALDDCPRIRGRIQDRTCLSLNHVTHETKNIMVEEVVLAVIVGGGVVVRVKSHMSPTRIGRLWCHDAALP